MLEAENIGLCADNASLKAENRRLGAECRRLSQEVRRLTARVSELESTVERLRRASKRQAAPHSKGTHVTHPKRPGRRPGEAYGTKAYRRIPDRIDDVVEVPCPASSFGTNDRPTRTTSSSLIPKATVSVSWTSACPPNETDASSATTAPPRARAGTAAGSARYRQRPVERPTPGPARPRAHLGQGSAASSPNATEAMDAFPEEALPSVRVLPKSQGASWTRPSRVTAAATSFPARA
jgi:hypothetical protein